MGKPTTRKPARSSTENSHEAHVWREALFICVCAWGDILDFNEPESLRICIVPSVARAIRGCLEGSLKSSMSRVYGVHNMFSAERARASNPRASVLLP